MDLKQQIERHIQSYLDGEISVSTFEQWFIPATWHVDPERDTVLGPLVAYVTSLLADFKDSEIDESELRDQLSQTGSRSSISATG
jgi:hypothetical protein